MGTIGIEWVKKYHGLAANLTNTKPQAEGFYNTLSATRQFAWGDDLAWDQDFEQQNVGSPSAGTDTTWADNVDMVFYQFVTYVAAAEIDEADAKRRRWPSARPSLLVA